MRKLFKYGLWTLAGISVAVGAFAATTYALYGVSPLQYWAGRSTGLDFERNNFTYADDVETVPLGSLGHVEKRGDGPIPMVLIPGHGFGWRVFEDFMGANEDRYTMYAVTLPGFGGTSPPPLPPEDSSYMDLIWTGAAEEALLELIRREDLDEVVVVGHFIYGGQLALRLAARHPDRLRAGIVIGGEARRGDMTTQERRDWVDGNLRQRWFRWVTPEVWVAGNWPGRIFSGDPDRAEELVAESNSSPLPVMIQYVSEHFASDVTRWFDDLEVPVLVLLPGFSEGFIEQPENRNYATIFHDSWEGFDEAPQLTVRTIPGAHVFTWKDRPAATYEAIGDFLDASAPNEREPAGSTPDREEVDR